MEHRIEYFNFEQDSNKAWVATFMQRFTCLLPHWVNEIQVTQKDEDNQKYATCASSPKYHAIHIDIYPTFWTLDDVKRADTLIHELAHTISGPFMNFVHFNIVSPLKEKNAELYEVLDRQLHEHWESLTEEMTIIFRRNLLDRVMASVPISGLGINAADPKIR